MQNYGYKVIDLGKDVEPQEILKAAKEYSVKLIGLSALMTTTVKSMEETICLVKKNLPQVKIRVGGAVLTDDYAKMVGADFYAKDAQEGVKIASKIYG